MFFWNTNGLTGATVAADTEAAVYALFSERYRVRKVRKGFPTMNGSTYHVHLQDGSELKVHLASRSSVFGGDQVYVNYIDET